MGALQLGFAWPGQLGPLRRVRGAGGARMRKCGRVWTSRGWEGQGPGQGKSMEWGGKCGLCGCGGGEVDRAASSHPRLVQSSSPSSLPEPSPAQPASPQPSPSLVPLVPIRPHHEVIVRRSASGRENDAEATGCRPSLQCDLISLSSREPSFEDFLDINFKVSAIYWGIKGLRRWEGFGFYKFFKHIRLNTCEHANILEGGKLCWLARG